MKRPLGAATLMGAIVELYVARVARAQARRDRARELEIHGRCEAGLTGDRCFESGDDQADWCQSCRLVQPYRDTYHAASRRAGVALARVLRMGKRLERGGR